MQLSLSPTCLGVARKRVVSLAGPRARCGLPCRLTVVRATEEASDPVTKAKSGPAGTGTDTDTDSDRFASKDLIDDVLDPTELGGRGEGWFVAQLVAFAVLLFPPAGLTGAVDSLALLSLLSGLALASIALYNLGPSLSPLPKPRKNHALVTDGIYGLSRHPMYGGVLLAALGLSVLSHNETRLLTTIGLWWILENKANLEEAALEELYPEYPVYKAKVKKFIPYLF
ncbi:hypothetical protein HXX76_004111 [Chlamydomonas incerta]|uniref:Protein-S-isoprenylcysteine O-methyltransferase n=1 Tax=Chlamydomonas incerta TaxID=51695 RepID=A0A835W7G2_CHLIN|nr:hypothetical protein HXX76_004111 [Chlamydomonas incerta]|eukprot:KAG2439994.1 hypothetical protein HXX76_004111 [Chlamydomonas incerta]